MIKSSSPVKGAGSAGLSVDIILRSCPFKLQMRSQPNTFIPSIIFYQGLKKNHRLAKASMVMRSTHKKLQTALHCI